MYGETDVNLEEIEKKCYWNKVKQEESRRMSNQFLLDPGRVCSSFKETIENQRDSDRPKNDTELQNRKDQKSRFKDLNEVTSFWKKEQATARQNGLKRSERR